MKKYFSYFGLLLIASIIFYLSPFFGHALSAPDDDIQLVAGVVDSVSVADDANKLTVQLKDGTSVTAMHYPDQATFARTFKSGDAIVMQQLTDEYVVQDYDRYTSLYILFVLFVLLVFFVSGMQGVGALLGLFFSFAVLFLFILPRILSGAEPVISVILGASAIIPVTFFFSHGVHRRTVIAIIGTLLTLMLSGFLAYYFADITHLTGLAAEEAHFLKIQSQQAINFKGVVLAGILISVLGVLDDITISQCSIIQQLKNAKPRISFFELFTRAMRVGRDHIASLVNTLILVYAGASLPLLLLFLDQSGTFRSFVSIETVSEEIVQMLIGSIALVLAVPITTVLGALFVKSGESVSEHHCGNHSH